MPVQRVSVPAGAIARTDMTKRGYCNSSGDVYPCGVNSLWLGLVIRSSLSLDPVQPKPTVTRCATAR